MLAELDALLVLILDERELLRRRWSDVCFGRINLRKPDIIVTGTPL